MHDAPYLFDGKDDARLVIGKHHGDKSRVRAKCRTQALKIKRTFFVNLKPRDFVTRLLQPLAQASDGLVLNSCRDDVALFGLMFEHAANSPVVGLASAGGEDYL